MNTKIKVQYFKNPPNNAVSIEFPKELQGCRAFVDHDSYNCEREMKGSICLIPVDIPDHEKCIIGIKMTDEQWNSEAVNELLIRTENSTIFDNSKYKNLTFG